MRCARKLDPAAPTGDAEVECLEQLEAAASTCSAMACSNIEVLEELGTAASIRDAIACGNTKLDILYKFGAAPAAHGTLQHRIGHSQ